MTTTTTKNPLVKLTEIEGRGRALVATQPVKPGEVLLRETPILVYSALPLNTSPYCFHCLRTLLHRPSISSCPSCSHHALFCSPNCQTLAAASSHSPFVCQALNSLRSYAPGVDSQIQLRFLIAAYNLALTSPSNFHLLLSLHGQPPSSTVDPQTLALHSYLSPLLPKPTSFSPELTAALLAKDKHNAFAFMEPFDEHKDRTVRGYAIYPNASFFNHDCLPNACRFDYVDAVNNTGDTNATTNTDIIVRAIHEIPQGREVCLSYFPVNWNYSDRLKRLLEDYGFSCDCDRCKVEMNWKEDDDMEGDEDDEVMEGEEEDNDNGDFPHAYFFLRYVCDGENCGGTLAPTPPWEEVGAPSATVMECNVCGRLRSEEEVMDGDSSQDGIMVDD